MKSGKLYALPVAVLLDGDRPIKGKLANRFRSLLAPKVPHNVQPKLSPSLNAIKMTLFPAFISAAAQLVQLPALSGGYGEPRTNNSLKHGQRAWTKEKSVTQVQRAHFNH